MSATRVIAVILFIRAALKLPLAIWFESVRTGLMDRTRDATESYAAYAIAINVSQVLDILLAISLALTFALTLGHTWSRIGALVALLLVLAEGAQVAFSDSIRSNYDVAVAFGLVMALGWIVVQLAATRALPALVALGALLLATIAGYALPKEAAWPSWVFWIVHAVAGLVVAFMAWRAPPTPSAMPLASVASLPTACRGIAACIVLRIVVVAGTVLGATWLRTNDGAPYAHDVMRGGFLVGSLIDLAMLFYLVLYARAPRLWRGAWLETGIALYVLSWICSAVSTHQSLELAALLATAQKATSIWGMPSLSDMERYQMLAHWSLRAAMALGLGTGLTVAAAAHASARALDDLPLAQRAHRLLGLVGAVGGIALVASIGLIVVRGIPTEAILVVAGLLLLAAAYTLTTWLRVFLPLASRIESMHTR